MLLFTNGKIKIDHSNDRGMRQILKYRFPFWICLLFYLISIIFIEKTHSQHRRVKGGH